MSENAPDVHSRLMDYLEAEEAPEETPEETPEQTQDPSEQIQETPEETPEVEAKEETPEETPEEETEEIIENPTLRDIAEHLETDLSALYAVSVPVTLPDGSKAEIPLGEIKDSYQGSEKVKAEREKHEQEMEKSREELIQKGQVLDMAYIQANHMIEAAEKQLLGEIDGPEMTQLRATNQAEYAIKKQEYMERLSSLSNMKQEAMATYQQQIAHAQQQAKEARKVHLQDQAKLLSEMIPEWSDNQVRESERSELSSFLVSSGIPEQEVGMIESAAVVAIARKAMLYDKQQKSNPKAKKKILNLGGKRVKSGKAPSKIDRRNEGVSKERQRIKETGSEELAAKFIEEHLLGDL